MTCEVCSDTGSYTPEGGGFAICTACSVAAGYLHGDETNTKPARFDDKGIPTKTREILKTLAGGAGSDEEHDVPCVVCSKTAKCPGFIWESVKLWNRDEAELAKANSRFPQYIRAADIGVTCSPECTAVEAEKRRKEYQLEIATTAIYLRDLKAGRYNPQTLMWLRNHGHAADVARVLSEEGNRAHG